MLAEAGYVWQGDVFDDDRPYRQTFDDGAGIIAIPLTMEVNDLPHAMRFGRSPGQFVELFDEALGHMLEGEDEAVILDATCHAHVYGRPTGACQAFAITGSSPPPASTDSARVSALIHSPCSRRSASAAGIVSSIRSESSRPVSLRSAFTRRMSS